MLSTYSRIIFQNSGLIMLLLLVLTQILTWRFWKTIIKSKKGQHFLAGTFLILNLAWGLTVAGLFLSDNPPPSNFIWDYIYRPAFVWQMLCIVWLIPAFFIESALKIWHFLFKRQPKGLPRLFKTQHKERGFLQPSALIFILGLGLSIFGYLQQLEPPEINYLTIEKADLNPRLDGFTIAVASDFHYGLWTSYQELDRYMHIIAELKPQLVLMAGDMVDKSADFAKDYKEPLSYLKGVPYGSFGVLGNHDHYTTEPEKVARHLTEGGLRILSDERVNLSIPISIIGFDDNGPQRLWQRNKSKKEELDFSKIKGPAIPEDNYSILIIHRPEGVEEAVIQGIDLMLSGHTHGGQYQIPGKSQWNFAAFFYRFSSGLYQVQNSSILVTRGLASVGIPFRLFAWPEINLITLKRI